MKCYLKFTLKCMNISTYSTTDLNSNGCGGGGGLVVSFCLGPGLTKFLCKGPDSKYFRLCALCIIKPGIFISFIYVVLVTIGA